MREVEGVIRLINRDRSDNSTPFDSSGLAGQYTWNTDQTLPRRHALQLYGSLTSDQTAVLFQARTGHCRLPVPLEERLSRVHNILHIMSEHLGAIQLTFKHGYSDVRGGIPCVDLSMV
jgi:hypothetical protein